MLRMFYKNILSYRYVSKFRAKKHSRIHKDLDVLFYKRYYKDLVHFKEDKDLIEHYNMHGKSEGRVPNPEELIIKLSEEFGHLPNDFSSVRYKCLNIDLSHLHEKWELEEHYLVYGRFEERAYGKIDLSGYEIEFSRLLREKALFTTDIYTKYPESFAQLLINSRVLPGNWLGRFNLYEFSILNASWLPRLPRTRIEGLYLFLQQGLDHLAPIAMDMAFDPDFIRQQSSTHSNASNDVDLYRNWLSNGIEIGDPGNEQSALRLLIGESHFPTCFDVDKYKLLLPETVSRNLRRRFDLLEHFISIGFNNIGCLDLVESQRLFVQISDYHLIRNNYSLALEACDIALNINPSNVMLLHRRGNALRGLGRMTEAANSYVTAVDNPEAGMWTHIHAAEGLAVDLKESNAAVDQLLCSAAHYHGEAEWRAAAHRVISEVFNIASSHAKALYADGKRSLADEHLVSQLDRLVEVIMKVDPLPGRTSIPFENLIVIVANRDLPQCDHYRVVQKLKQLLHGGWKYKIFSQDEADKCRPSLDQASAVIFYRVAAFPAIVHAILYARALGLPTIYEIDDLLFESSSYPDPFESFEGQINAKDYVNLQYGVPLFQYAMRLCDFGIASTPALAESMKPHIRTGICYVLRNGLDQRNTSYLTRSLIPFTQSAITIFYGSGTKAHNLDFSELVAPALLEILSRYKHVRLLIAGYLNLDRRFAPFDGQVRQLGFTSNIEDYWEVLSGVDINIAVLKRSAMTDAKSEIKWLEAAMFGIPSIVSRTRTYRELLVEGDTALFADTPIEWSQALETLIVNTPLRHKIGARAREKLIKEYSLDSAVEVLAKALPRPNQSSVTYNHDHILPVVENKAIRGRKTRVLIINVFFPPQIVGGATRVVRDNLDYFLNNASDRFEFAVMAADVGAEPPYKTRIDNYRGVPVYRVAVPRNTDMDWRPLDPEMEIISNDLSSRFMPDIVHVHCVQQLTASVVESLRARGVPYIITLHDAWWISDFQFLIDSDGQVHTPSPDPLSDAANKSMNPIASLARRRVLSRILDGAETLLAVSENFAALYHAAGHSKAIAVPNGFPVFKPLEKSLSSSGKVRLGQIGGRTTHKGATLIEAVLRETVFKNLIFTLVDHAQPTDIVREEVWGTTPVRIIGRMPQNQISKLYAELDVLLAPSLWPESFGLVTREAQASGLWVVASDRGAIGADITEGVDGYRIDVSTPDGLQAILSLMDANPHIYCMSPPRTKSVLRSTDHQGRDIIDIYCKILEMDG